MVNSNVEEQYRNLEEEAERQPRTANAAEPLDVDAAADSEAPAVADNATVQAAKPSAAPASSSSAAAKKEGRRGKRKADVVRPGPLYQIVDAIITIAGLALVGAVILYIIMIFG